MIYRGQKVRNTVERTPRLSAEVVSVHSGDDMMVVVDLGVEDLSKKVRVRLKGVDAPDAFNAKPGSPAAVVRDRVWDLVMGKQCLVDVHSSTSEKKGWMVTLFLIQDEEGGCMLNINRMLVGQGYVFSKDNVKGGK